METIIDKKFGRTDVFEPTTEFPDGYVVWNIGRANFPHEKCIPLARLIGEYRIDLNSLRYIKVETEETALRIIAESYKRGIRDRKRFYEILNEV